MGFLDDSHYLVTTNKLKNYLEDNITAYLNQYSAFSGETLFDDLYDIQAGEYIMIQNTHLTKQQYWNFPKKRQLKSKPTQVDLNEIIKCFDKVFGRMIHYLSEKNQIVYLPLSGGMDSRLLAWALKNISLGGDIIAFTYGQSLDQEEVAISQRVANELGIKWEFIEYDSQNISELYNDICDNLYKFNIGKIYATFTRLDSN